MSVVYSPACIKYSGNYAEMESKNGHPQQQRQKRYHHHKNSGLLRYRSAPSSLLTDLVEDSHGCVNEIEEASRGLDHHHHHHPHHQQQQQQNRYVPCLGSEMEAMLAKLLSSSSSSSNNGWNNVKQEGEAGGSVFSHDRPDHLIYNSQEFQGFLNGSSCSSSSSSVMMSNNTMALENSGQSKMGSGNCSNLLMRQKSYPPGFLSNFSVRNGFVALGEQATTSTCGLNGTLTFSSGPSSCSGRMPQIAENGNETLEEEEEATTCVPSSRNLRNDNSSHRSHNIPSFTSDFWENSAFTAPKPVSTDNDEFIFSVSDALESQHADGGYHNLGLSHQLNLPSSSTKIASKERFLKIQGSVPCKIRAKRGFATHPRSIAERIRRTRISERIKKLQELFPKSDKQTSTADMLDLAVDYIKNLQEQVKVLTDTKAKCTCSSSQKQYSRPSV